MTQVTTTAANWKNEPATEKQIAYIRKLAKGEIDENWVDKYDLTKGEASAIIEKYRVMSSIARRRTHYASDDAVIVELGHQIGCVLEGAKKREVA